MKNTRKIALALVIVMMMLMSLATIPTFADSSSEEVTIYFKNNWLWTDVCCHYWGVESGETVWPGTPMINVDTQDGHEIYSITIPANVEGIVINGVKDDGSGNRDQTPDIATGITNGAGWTMDWADGNVAVPFVYTGTGTGGSASPVVPQDTYLYIKNDANWESVYFYCWNLDGGAMEQWPGEAMTAVGDGYYVAFLPGNLNYTHMKFSDGAGQETSELRIPYGGNTLYNNSTKSWSEAPELDLGGIQLPDGYEKPDNQTPDNGAQSNPQKLNFFQKIWLGITNFFKNIGKFFINLFGGKKK